MSWASAGLALPANKAIASESTTTFSDQSAYLLAGVEGFEPPNGGIKTRCLTTWRHPNCLTVRASAQVIQQWRPVEAARDDRAPRVRDAGRDPLRARSAREFSEHTRSGTREPR